MSSILEYQENPLGTFLDDIDDKIGEIVNSIESTIQPFLKGDSVVDQNTKRKNHMVSFINRSSTLLLGWYSVLERKYAEYNCSNVIYRRPTA